MTTVDYYTSNGTANSGDDYIGCSGRLSFWPGQTSKTITVTVRGDNVLENDENFYVMLTNPVNATILDGGGKCTIINDDLL